MRELELKILDPSERVLGEPSSHRMVLALVVCCIGWGSACFPLDHAMDWFLVGIVVVGYEDCARSIYCLSDGGTVVPLSVLL